MKAFKFNGKTYQVSSEKFLHNTRAELNTERTLREIRESVQGTRQYNRTPSANLLRCCGDIVAAKTSAEVRIEVYSCGFVVYQAYNKVAAFRMESVGHIWYAGEPELERGKQDIDLSEASWTIAVMMRGEYLLEGYQQRFAEKRQVPLSNPESDDESDEGVDEYEIDASVDVEAEVLNRMEEEEILSLLSLRQRECAEMYYGMGMTQQEIADAVGIRQQNVNKALKGALESAKKFFEKI